MKLIGTAAPALSLLPGAYGAFTDIAALKGKVVVLDFFAHWCGPCKASFPDTRSMSDALGDKLAVIGVTAYYGYYGTKKGIDEKEEFGDMREFIDQYKIDHPVVYVQKDEFVKYGVSGIPEFVLIGKDGNVKKIQLGYSKESFADFRKAVEEETAK
jgi:thiol-disulfide isomerase/thioredoxin